MRGVATLALVSMGGVEVWAFRSRNGVLLDVRGWVMGYYCFVEKMGLLNVWCGVVTRIMILELRGIWWGKAEGRVESLGKILLIKGRKRKEGCGRRLKKNPQAKIFFITSLGLRMSCYHQK